MDLQYDYGTNHNNTMGHNTAVTEFEPIPATALWTLSPKVFCLQKAYVSVVERLTSIENTDRLLYIGRRNKRLS